MNESDRMRFDAIFEQVLDELPPALHDLIERTPLILEDDPDPQLLKELGLDAEDDLLCGLHTGTPLTERSVEADHHPEYIHLFRRGIIELAGGWEPWIDDDGTQMGGDEAVREQIYITLLHEIGHHYGLDEQQLEEYGYG